MADGNDSKSLDADYLAALRDTDLYKEQFDIAYRDPESVLTSVGNVRGMFSQNTELFDVDRQRVPWDSSPRSNTTVNVQDYGKVAQQLRQFIGTGQQTDRLTHDRLVRQLAMSEALESHEQQGVRFDDRTMGRNREAPIPGRETARDRGQSFSGFPKSTRSMGQTVEPLTIPSEQKTADQTLMENMRKK